MSTHHVPVKQPHRLVVAPMTRLGSWSVALVACWVVFALGAFVTPEDSVWAVLDLVLGLSSGLAAAIVTPTAIFRRGDRSLAVYAAALVFIVGVLWMVFHPLFISD